MEGPETRPSAGAVDVQRRRRSRRRWLRFVLTVVIAGPVLTVVSALAMAAWADDPRWRVIDLDRARFRLQVPPGLGDPQPLGVQVREGAMITEELAGWILLDVAGEQGFFTPGTLPTFQTAWDGTRYPTRPDILQVQLRGTAVGWPWRCLFVQELAEPSAMNSLSFGAVPSPTLPVERLQAAGVLVPAVWEPAPPTAMFTPASGTRSFTWSSLTPKRSLPMRPLWSGFVLNSVVLGLFAGLMCILPATVRQRIRRSRGRCEGCGYELAGLGRCPECGTAAVASRELRAAAAGE